MTMSGSASVLKPQPRVNALTRPFWDGANERRLMIQRCTAAACGRAVFYPRVCCPYCRSPQLEWIQAAGSGRVISHTTVHRTHHDGFNGDVPYVFAAIALDEGPCMYAQMPGAPIDGRSLIGRPVRIDFVEHGPQRIDFVEHGPQRLMPVFRLADSTA